MRRLAKGLVLPFALQLLCPAAGPAAAQDYAPFFEFREQQSLLEAPVDYDIVTALDVSGSMSMRPGFIEDNIAGMAHAMGDPLFRDLLLGGVRRTARLEFFFFSGTVAALAGPTLVKAGEDTSLERLADALRQAAKIPVPLVLLYRNATNMPLALERGIDILNEKARGHAARRIINIVTDVDGDRFGSLAQLTSLRDRARTMGIEINVLHLGEPSPSVHDYFAKFIANGFVLDASAAGSLDEAYARKFEADVAGLKAVARSP